tara:strand:- start:653 stop:934 length:282 start_codon:yes stop_codon:yes gene_type:complete
MSKAQNIAGRTEGHRASMGSSVQNQLTNGVKTMAYVKHAMMATEECIFIASEQLEEATKYLNEIGMKALAVKIENMKDQLTEIDVFKEAEKEA